MNENIYKTIIQKRGALILQSREGRIFVSEDAIQAMKEIPPIESGTPSKATSIWIKGANSSIRVENNFDDILQLLDEEYPNKEK